MNLILNEFCGKTDDELALLAKSSRMVVEALVLRFSRLILIKAELFSSNNSDCDDFRQEGLMGLLNAVYSFNPEKSVKFSTYAEVCIVNRMRTYAVKLNRKTCDVISIDDIPDNVVYTEENPEKIYINKEFFSELWNIVDSQLSSLERQVFEQVIQGNTYEEIAENLDISPKSVANAVHRARGKIRCGLNKNI